MPFVTQAGLSDDKAALANSAFWGAFTVGRVLGVSAASSSVSGASVPMVC